MTTFQYQGFTNEQIVDLTRRVLQLLTDPKSGLPEGDLVTRSVVNEVETDLAAIEFRLGLERKGAWTDEKKRAEKQRDEYLRALRKGAKEIQKDPDPAITEVARAGGKVLHDLFAKHPAGFERKGGADNSGALKLFFADFDRPEAQRALRDSGLIRYYTPLLQAQADYAGVVAKIVAHEASQKNEAELPKLREAKQSLSEHVRLLLQILAHMGRKGIAPYESLSAKATLILEEVANVRQGRQTRKDKAATKDGISA
jgi:hypothetical protein